jgi:1L-myo-inositol 1-phosphate cytidylyltransferase
LIDRAVVLAAGVGSRLRDAADFKPLCRVGGATLLDHTLAGLATAGVREAVVVTGYGADAVEAHLAASAQPLAWRTVTTPDWLQPNGVSALAGLRTVNAPALLVMCDHLVDPELYRRLAAAGAGSGGLTLGVDRRLDHGWIDLDDVTRVRTDGQHILAIGKQIEPYDAFDTGVFAADQRFVDVLARLASPSLSEGVQRLPDAAVQDVSGLDWLDVDDPRALAIARQWRSAKLSC